MRVATSILFDVARAVNLGIQSPREASVEIPPVLLPYIKLPLAQLEQVVVAPADPKRTSFTADRVIVQPAATGQNSQQVCTFGEGVWYLDCLLWFVSSFTDFAVQPGGATLFLMDPRGNQNTFLQAEPVANVPQILRGCLETTFVSTPEGAQVDWQFRLQVEATGVGETMQAKALIHASKLL